MPAPTPQSQFIEVRLDRHSRNLRRSFESFAARYLLGRSGPDEDPDEVNSVSYLAIYLLEQSATRFEIADIGGDFGDELTHSRPPRHMGHD